MSDRFDRLRDIFGLEEEGKVNNVLEQQRRLAENFAAGESSGGVSAGTLLTPILDGLNWGGEPRQIIEALPQDGSINNAAELRAVLHRLGLSTESRRIRPSDADADDFPAILANGESPAILVSNADGRIEKIDADGHRSLPDFADRWVSVFTVAKKSFDPSQQAKETGSWMFSAMGHLKRSFILLAAVSFVTNMLSLVMPLLVMAVYNLAVSTRSVDTLLGIVGLVLAVLGLDLVMRRKRSRLIADLGARIDRELSTDAFRRILSLPLHMTETAAVSTQIARLRQFTTIRDAFTGHIASAMLDLPFTLFFIAAIAIVGGGLVWIPVGLGALLIVSGLILYPVSNQVIQTTGGARSRSQSLVHEVVSKSDAIRWIEAEDIFTERFRVVAREEADLKASAAGFNAFLHSGSQAVVTVGGLLTLCVGALMTIDGNMSFGGLIAVMMLVWRVLSPMQVAFLSLSRVGQLRNTIRQVNTLMRMQGERSEKNQSSMTRRFKGTVDLVGLGFRYSALSEPAIRSVMVRIPAGQRVAIAGPSGSGKSTTLKLILGLYQPQAGVVRIDGLDIRQMDPAEVRSTIGYCPQDLDVFSGTVAENLWFSNPTASDNDMWDALAAAGLSPDDPLLPNGLATPVEGGRGGDTSSALRQIISLARVYLRNPPIMLFDEPGTYLDAQGDKRFIEMLSNLGGRATAIVSTNRPSHMRACDRVLVIEDGQVVADGQPEEVLAGLSKGPAARPA